MPFRRRTALSLLPLQAGLKQPPAESRGSAKASGNTAGAILLAGLALLTPPPANADQLSRIRQAGTVRVAIAGAVPPFNFENDHKELIGSDVETASLLARDLGVRLQIVRITNSERISVLQEQQADLVVSALSITPERERLIAFSVPYARIAVVIAAPLPHKLSSMLDLSNKTVGALAASSNLAHLRKNAPNSKVIEYPENDKLGIGYISNEFEIMTAPESVVTNTNRMNPKRPLIVQFTQMEFDVAVGMPKGEKSLREWVNNWVVSRLRDNSLGEIYRRHHGQKLPGTIIPPSATVRGK